MNIHFDSSGFEKERAFAANLPKKTRGRIWASVRAVSFDAERYIKIRMPVDTGRARASWGHSSAPAGADEGIWQENENDLTLVQGSRVEYIEPLNEGHSKQAPAGFIDAESRRAQEKLDQLVAADIEAAFR